MNQYSLTKSRTLQWIVIILIATVFAGGIYKYFQAKAAKINTSQNLNTNGLVGHWTFDGGDTTWATSTTGTTADVSDSGNTGTLTNMTRSGSPVLGKIGQGLTFNGSNQYFNISDPADGSLDFGTGDFASCAWVKTTSASGSIVGKNTWSCNDWGSWLQADGTVRFEIKGVNPPCTGASADTTVVNDGKWHQVCASYDRDANLSVYTDGTFSDASSIAALASYDNNNTAPFRIGYAGPGYFNGQIDDVRLYSRTLSDSEIADLYQTGVTKLNVTQETNTSGLAGHWTFDGKDTVWTSSSAATATDLSGNSNTGTLTNMTRSGSPVMGKLGQALTFNGTNNYVSIPNSSALNPTNVTVAAWVKTNTAGGYIVTKAKDSSGTETLRPNGAGSETAILTQFPASDAHWDKVSEASPDDNTTYVYAGCVSSNWCRDLYALPDHSAGSGTINSVTVYARLKDTVAANSTGKISIRTEGVTYDTSAYALTTSWADQSNTWTTNPQTGSAWTWAEIDALEAGISLTQISGGGAAPSILKGQPILMADGSQKSIEDIQVGDEITSYNIDSRRTEKDRVVWTGGGPHDDYLIFNGILKTSLNHVIWSNGEYKPATDIKVGDFLTNSLGQEVEVTRIEYIQERVDTYDLEVENNHNFFASNYLVHNITTKQGSATQVYAVVDYTAAVPYSLSTVGGGQFTIINNGTTYTATSSASITDNQWHYVVGTYDGTTMRIYVDGTQTGTSSSFSGNLPTTTGVFRIGADYNTSPGNFFTGSIDDARVYNRALSVGEVADLYQTGVTKLNVTQETNTSGLAGHWTFDGKDTVWTSSSAATATDLSGNSNTGTLTNMTRSASPVLGKIGQALTFNGSTNYISVPNDSSLNPTNVTVAAWVKTNTAGGYIIAKDPPSKDSSQVEPETNSISTSTKKPLLTSFLGFLTINKVSDYIAVHKNTSILLILFILLISGLGWYKSKQKKVSSGVIILAMAFSGSAALIYEVAATQALTYFFNSSSYSVATAIVSFLLGLALGSFILSRYLHKITNPIKTLVMLQVLAGLYALLILPQYGYIVSAMSFLYDIAAGSVALILATKFLVGIIFLLLPTLMLGASFPLASSLIIKDIKMAGSDVARLYSWDLIGAVFGALISGFILLPIFGLTMAFVFGAVMNLVAGMLLSKIDRKKLWLTLLTVAIFIPLVTFAIQSRSLVLVGAQSSSLEPVVNKDILFTKESAYGQILVTDKNAVPELFISKIKQCGSDYPPLLKNLSAIVGTFSSHKDALDIGLGCGYSSKTLADNSEVNHLDIVEINPVLSETLKYFENDDLLKNDKVTLHNDDAMYFLARTQNTYDLINAELNMPSLPQISPFYSVEYFQLVKQKMNTGGTFRLWVCCGNYEFVKTVYKTLRQVFPLITIKTDMDPREGKDYYYNTEFILGGDGGIVSQTVEEKKLQTRIMNDTVFRVSTLDNQSIGKIWYDWSQQNFKEYFVQPVALTQGEKPLLKDAYVFPLDVKPGDSMKVGVRVLDESGVTSVTSSFPYEGGEDSVALRLVSGTKYDGLWKGEWGVHNTIDKKYISRLVAKNKNNSETEKTIEWSDFVPPVGCSTESLSLDSGTYSADVGSTFSVITTFGMAGGACTYSIEDDTSGSYTVVPTTDTDLDCNGAVCSKSNNTTPWTNTLKCEAAGTYNIQAASYSAGSLLSPVSTVTCTAVGPSNMPYALSTVSGGQFTIISGGTTYNATSSVSVADNQWHYVVGTYDGTTMKIFVDGAQTGSNSSFSGNLPTSKTGALHIGADYNTTPANFFTGSIDDARVYNRALSATEVAGLYNAGR